MNLSPRRNIPRIATLLSGILISTLLIWFAAHHYAMSTRLAGENLRGLALSLSAAIETIGARDPSFASLKDFRTSDIAYFSLIDRDGVILFHTNGELTGKITADSRFRPVFDRGEFSSGRILLGTGEQVFESNAPVHMRGSVLALRLALHTYRADNVVRMARIGLFVTIVLTGAAWTLSYLLFRFAAREEAHKKELARQRELARLGELGAVIAHEIRNPLAGIKGYAQLLEEKLEHDRDGEFATLIVSEAVRLEEIVNGLLSYTQSGPGTMEPVLINDALERALALVSADAVAANVIISRPPLPRLELSGNRDRLEQLFLNLFGNALQAMPAGGTLTITARKGTGEIEVLVADTGQGIEEEHLRRIFEPFFTTRARGAGLGLAVCEKIMTEHGGTIVAESEPGRGTVIRLRFPAG